MTRVLVLNGPNLGRLGTREPDVYGRGTLDDLRLQLEEDAPEDVLIDVRQTDDEGTLIGWLHEAVDKRMPVILNPAAFTHYSIAIHDALEAADVPVVEVHISNVHRREPFRHTSYVSLQADAVIAGAGAYGYELAVDWLLRTLEG